MYLPIMYVPVVRKPAIPDEIDETASGSLISPNIHFITIQDLRQITTIM